MNAKETTIKILQKYGSVRAFARTIPGTSYPLVYQVIKGTSHPDSLRAEIIRRRLVEENLLVEEVAQ